MSCEFRLFTIFSLAFNKCGEYKQGVSSSGSGRGIMTPPGLELNKS